MPSRITSCVGVLVVLAAGQTLPSKQDSLNDQEVRRAIEAGLEGVVAPRELRWVLSGPVTAVAYSPEIRIGIAARELRARGKTPSVESFSTELRERVIYVALRSQPHVPDPGVSLRDSESRMYLVPRSFFPEKDRIAPVWLSHDPSTVLKRFGATPPFEDIAIIAAFPESAVRAGWSVIGARQDLKDHQRFHTWSAVVTSEDVAALHQQAAGTLPIRSARPSTGSSAPDSSGSGAGETRR